MRKSYLARWLVNCTVATAVAAGGVLAVTTPASATLGGWERISAYHSGLVATVPNPWTPDDLQVEQQPYAVNAYNMQWKLTTVGANTYTIQNRFSSKCLDTENGVSTTAGTPVVQRTCDGTRSQWWIRTQDPILPIWRIQNEWSGLYLGVENGSQSSGAGFIQSVYLPNNTSRMFQMW